ncbi:MAG: 16S rRNA (uracil(1498)-N(3))-methyltransferase [Clostridia bacterium]|nr:16S rRNA (uracil(1498)-N(3))-methyltransferase [Clostridia bacterium]
MHRFYADEIMPDGTAHLAEEDARHASRVLRLKAGDVFQLLCGGERYEAELVELQDTHALCRVGEKLPTTEAKLRITLYHGLPKADKMELIVQKAVELGAAAVVPVAMSRSVTKLDAKDGIKKRDRWQKIAREASKQSGRCTMMEVASPVSFKQLTGLLQKHQAAIVPWEDARGYGLQAFHAEHPDITDLAVVIGPEGGISEEEIEAMKAAGCRSVTLGPRILRTETAAIASIAALMCLYGEMDS